MASIALDQLALARDRLCGRVGVLGRAGIALFALPVVGAVVASEGGEPAVAKLPDPGHGRIEEGPVMRRDQQRPGPLAEVVLEPLERVEIEVVRRFVEQSAGRDRR